MVPFPQPRSLAGQYLSQPQQIRSGDFGCKGTRANCQDLRCAELPNPCRRETPVRRQNWACKGRNPRDAPGFSPPCGLFPRSTAASMSAVLEMLRDLIAHKWHANAALLTAI